MWGHVFIWTFIFWWRGSLACRVAVFPWWWIVLIGWRFEDEPPHATGWHRIYIIAVMLACGVLAWLIAGLPTYLRAAYSMAHHAWCSPAVAQARCKVGSMGRPVRRVAASPSGLPRLSR